MQTEDKLNEIYKDMLGEKRTLAQRKADKGISLVDFNLAGYKKDQLKNVIVSAIDMWSEKKNLPTLDSSTVDDILHKLRFKKMK